MTSYAIPFVIGGVTVAGIKFLSNRVAPKYAALLGALPIGYVSTYYIDDIPKTMSYLMNYSFSLGFIILGAILYYVLLAFNFRKIVSLIIGFSFILLLTIVKLEFFPKI